MGDISISETSTVFKEDTKPTMENMPGPPGSGELPNISEADPAYQDFLSGLMTDEPSVVNVACQAEVGTDSNVWQLTDY